MNRDGLAGPSALQDLTHTAILTNNTRTQCTRQKITKNWRSKLKCYYLAGLSDNWGVVSHVELFPLASAGHIMMYSLLMDHYPVGLLHVITMKAVSHTAQHNPNTTILPKTDFPPRKSSHLESCFTPKPPIVNSTRLFAHFLPLNVEPRWITPVCVTDALEETEFSE